MIKRKYFSLLGITLIITIITVFYISGFHLINTWIPRNDIRTNYSIFPDNTTPMLIDPRWDIWIYNSTEDSYQKWLYLANFTDAIDIKYIFMRDYIGTSRDFILSFWNTPILLWNDSRYGFIINMYPDLQYLIPLESNSDPIYYEFTLLCENGNITFFDNSTIKEYWNGTAWITSLYNLTPTIKFDVHLVFKDISQAIVLKYWNFTSNDLRYDFLFRGYSYYQANESIRFYDWIPGEDFEQLVNDNPLFNVILITIVIITPTWLIADYFLFSKRTQKTDKARYKRKKRSRKLNFVYVKRSGLFGNKMYNPCFEYLFHFSNFWFK